MKRRRLLKLRRTTVPALVLGTAVLLLTAGSSFTSGMDVPANSHVIDNTQSAITADSLKPADCASTTLTQVVSPGESVREPDSGALILADATTTSLTGGSGGDCIIGGGATTAIDGGPGNDVCIGNASTIFSNCETVVRNP